jgi:hypothetical protein
MNFLETLKQEESVPPVFNKPSEVRPVVISYVTLGKELHVGHLLLMATATLAQAALGDTEPLILINNNTGPRVAGALINLAETNNLSLQEAAKLASSGQIRPSSIIEAYRARNEQSPELLRATALLDEGKYDIFKSVASSLGDSLLQAGFNTDIIGEASLLVQNQRALGLINPLWSQTGFTYFAEKGLSILEQTGQITATGKCFTSLLGAAKQRIIPGEEPFVVLVDASVDSLDAVRVFSSLNFGQATLLPGAGISFNGEIASGTGGEAITLSELTSEFASKCPEGNILQALKHLVLAMPGSRARAEIMCLYDFKDNDSLVDALVNSYSNSQGFISQVDNLLLNLEAKQGSESQALGKAANDLLAYLPQRIKSLTRLSPEDIIRKMGKFTTIPSTDIYSAVLAQGYSEQAALVRAEGYATGPKELALRGNLFMETLKSLMYCETQITSLTADQFNQLKQMIDMCLGRLGYVKS